MSWSGTNDDVEDQTGVGRVLNQKLILLPYHYHCQLNENSHASALIELVEGKAHENSGLVSGRTA